MIRPATVPAIRSGDRQRPGTRTARCLPLAAAALVALAVSGCTVRPTGSEFAAALSRGEDVRPMLARGRFEDIDLAVFSGPRPQSGRCEERAIGGALAGVDVVRVCFVDGRPEGVYTLHTHGRPWTRLWPFVAQISR